MFLANFFKVSKLLQGFKITPFSNYFYFKIKFKVKKRVKYYNDIEHIS